MTASALLREFRDVGVLDALDVQFAQTLSRLSGEVDPRVLLGARGSLSGKRSVTWHRGGLV